MEASAHTQERYADKIAALLRKAERTDKPGEAEVFLQGAQRLMTKYAISEEMLARARGEREQEPIVEEEIRYTGIFHRALYDVGAAIAEANGCQRLIGTRANETVLYIVGFKSDVDRVRMLDTSVQIQMTGALTQWWRTVDSSWMSKMDKFKDRREFIMGFARGLRAQLLKARDVGRQDAAQDEAKRADVTVAEASESVALVVRSREQRVSDWMDQRYGDTIQSVSRRYQRGGPMAHAAGNAAGVRADVSGVGDRIRGTGRQLPGGGA